MVVYGKPALLCTINLRVFATIAEQKKNDKIIVTGNFFKDQLSFTNQEIKNYTQEVKNKWEEYKKTNNISLIKPFTETSHFLQIIIGETLNFLKKDLTGVEITINSQVPMATNFGGSASVSAALAGAIFKYFGQALDKEKIYEVVYETEKRAHGNPSGGDPAVIIYGGLLWFRRETEFLKLRQNLSFPKFPQYLIINSGRPQESTAEMVHEVGKLYHQRPKYTEKLMNQMEKLKKEYLLALKNNQTEELIRIARADVRLLYKLGAVSEKTMVMIRDLENMGAGVSVSGAGGKKANSGALIVLAQDCAKIREYCQTKKLQIFECDFQTEGVKEEKR